MKLTKWLVLLLIIAGCEQNPTVYVNSQRCIVVLKKKCHRGKCLGRLGIRPIAEYDIINGFMAEVDSLKREALLNDPDVLSVEPDAVLSICAQTLPNGVNRIEADLNPIAKIDGKDERVDVDIAILDTGVDDKHPDLNVFRSFDFTGEGTQDRHGHGTHVSGIAAALDNGFGVVGVAPGARITSLKCMNRGGSGFVSGIISAIDYAVSLGDIEVINMSLGGLGYVSAFHQAVQAAVNSRIVVVVAAGNSGVDLYGWDKTPFTWDDFEPACFPEAMAISAMVDEDGVAGGLDSLPFTGGDDFLATFSNHSDFALSTNPVVSPGAKIDIAMPGVFVLSTWPHRKYVQLSGTSMASPHGAGLVALYIAKYGKPADAAGVYAVRQAIIDNAMPQESWRLDGFMNDTFDDNHEGLGNCLF